MVLKMITLALFEVEMTSETFLTLSSWTPNQMRGKSQLSGEKGEKGFVNVTEHCCIVCKMYNLGFFTRYVGFHGKYHIDQDADYT
jgi:hypothetical protein